MGNRYLNIQVDSTKPYKEFKDTCAWIFQTTSGSIHETQDGFLIQNGNAGIQMSFLAVLTATVIIRQTKENRYSVEVFLNWVWSGIMWLFLVIGILGAGLPLVLLLLYLFYDPSNIYNQVLYRIASQERP
jgi:hypothetical protein